MNKYRRKEIEEVENDLYLIKNILERIKDEEEEYRDNIPENLQNSMRYEKADDACTNLLEALDAIYNALEYIAYAQAE